MINNLIKIDLTDSGNHAIKPDIKALVAIENTLGLTTLKLCQEIGAANIGFNMVATILQCGLKSGTGTVDRSVIDNAIMEKGLMGFMEPIEEFFKIALEGTGGKKPQADPEN